MGTPPGQNLNNRHLGLQPPLDHEPTIRRFRTTTPELERLVDWLQEQSVVSVTMESTSVYWIPLYELLESRCLEVVLVNARHRSGVPGRKSDLIDCQWLQTLPSCGLLKGSFRPHESICRLRALQRERANLVAERTRIVQRMQKAPDQINVQVHHAVTDRKLAVLIFRMLRCGQDYVDEGVAAYEARFHHRRLTHLIETAQQLGYRLVPAVEAAEVSGESS